MRKQERHGHTTKVVNPSAGTEEIFNSLNQILSSLNISHEYYDELKEQEANRKINQAFNQQANVVIKENNSNNSTNNDSQLSAKDILLKKMKEAQKK